MQTLPAYAVKVGSGSGCLFRPLSDKFMYVLTAKHNIPEQGNVLVERENIINGDVHNETLNVLRVFMHPKKEVDACIIKIQNIDIPGDILRVEDYKEIFDNVWLSGYPKNRANAEYSYRADGVSKILNVKENNYIEAELTKPAGIDEVLGQSGGGLVKVDGDQLFLVGIQKRMSAAGEEPLGRIDFMPLELFDEIVDANKAELVELLPYYMGCFSYLKDQAMKLEGCAKASDVEFAKKYLQAITDEIVKGKLTPVYISNFFKERILVYQVAKRALQKKSLWLAWLEFLIVMNIIKGKCPNNQNLEEIFNNFRLIYSDTKRDWLSQLEEIMRSDFHGLKDKGIIIVATDTEPKKTKVKPDIIMNIAQASSIQKKEFKIDDAIDHPFKNYSLIHICAFQRDAIIEKEEEYSGFNAMNENQLLDKLKEEYGALLS